MKNLLLVLTVIRDSETRSFAKSVIESAGHRVIESVDYPNAKALLANGLEPDLLLVDSLPGHPSETLRRLRLLEQMPKCKICLLVGSTDQKLQAAARSVRIERFLVRPATRGKIESIVKEMSHSLAYPGIEIAPCNTAGTEAQADESAVKHHSHFHLEELECDRFFLAASPKMLEIYRQVRLIAEVNVPVLILGETGTGKEVIAHLIHKLSRRSRERFLNLNCAALPSDLVESELFGHRQGAFTGALRDQQGMVERANRGTLLLDEVGEISVQMQAKLLHVIQDGQFTRLGGQESTKVDVRILAATNIDMERALAEKTFREDLYYRLNTFKIDVPPLRERREEIPYLIEETIRRTPHGSKKLGKSAFTSRLIDVALEYNWPGNLRELRNFVTRAIVMGDHDGAFRELENRIVTMSPSAGSHRLRSAEGCPAAMRSLVADVKNRTEMQVIQAALEFSGWNRRRAAEALDISYRGLLYKIHQHRLMPNR